MGQVSACGQSSSPSEASKSAEVVESGSWYFKNQWPHDGNPIESQNFVVYSDAASLDARQRLADLAEEVLAETIVEMGIDPETMFRFPSDQTKIDLYANKNNLPDWGGGARGYYAGLIIWSFDHQAEERRTDLDYFRPVLKHELVHVVESLLKGRFVGDIPGDDPRRMPVWFSEGMAEALSGGTSDQGVRSLDQIGELTAEYGQISPIKYRVDFPVSEDNTLKVFYYYYPMSGLAVEYLIDPDGLGKTPEDLTSIMVDMADDTPFPTAFEDHMGITVAHYQDQFFDLMDDYLPPSDTSKTVSAISLVLVSVVAASLMAGGLIWSLRPSRATVSGTVPAGDLGRSQRSRRGFITETTTAAVVAVGFFVWLLIAIATADGPSDVKKAWGLATLVAYLLASLAILIWAIRRWTSNQRAAHQIPLLVLVAIGITVLITTLIF